MSTQVDYYSVDETPVECDPPDYDEAFPIEEQMLEYAQGIRSALNCCWMAQSPDVQMVRDDVMHSLAAIEDYIKQCVADRDRPDERAHDADAEFTDPFADE